MTDHENNVTTSNDLVAMVSEVVASFVSNNKIDASELPDIIHAVFDSFSSLSHKNGQNFAQKPAVQISKSFTDDYIICLEDGAKLKMLKRYLRTHHNMSPEEYRLKWGLSSTYPMVAPSYAARRSAFAKKNGLGRSRKATE